MNPAQYFREYRNRLGFSNQAEAKAFLAAKDVLPTIDFMYIKELNQRLTEIFGLLNQIITPSLRHNNLPEFTTQYICRPSTLIHDANLLPRLNNQGRRPEEVLFSWLRGYAVCHFFSPAFAHIFNIPLSSITNIGDDDLQNIDTFKRSPQADLSIMLNGKPVRLEIQSGFQGINDIKEHKVREARRIKREENESTICIHIDVYNGQVAFVQLDTIEEQNVNFITRQQMEGQSIFQIDQNYFKWRLIDPAPSLDSLELSI